MIETQRELEDLIIKYSHLPKNFLVTFALYCANDVSNLIKDQIVIRALEVTQLWLDGKATDEEMRVASNAAYAAYYAASNAAYAAYAAYAASSLNVKEHHYRLYKNEFIRLLNTFSKVERLIYNIDEKDLC